ncbi:glycosyltransferase-like protein LARGE, partial [Schistosoma bovis]
MLITWSIFHVISPNTTPDWIDDPLNSPSDNKIHIVILFDGDRGLQYLNSLLKSIFYYQNGRFRCDLKPCCLSNFCDRFMNDCQTVMNNVIVLDIDILLNTDIIELWNHFNYFKETQSIGIGLEQNPYFQEVMTKLESNWKGYGYNNGVLLLHLSKLRPTNWNHLWMNKTRRALEKQGYLTTGEQDILNLMLFQFKYILYEIPCEWNIQLSSGSDEQRCPVSWLTYKELKKRNYTTIVKQPKLIHINHHTKPNDIKLNEIPAEYIDYLD